MIRFARGRHRRRFSMPWVAMFAALAMVLGPGLYSLGLVPAAQAADQTLPGHALQITEADTDGTCGISATWSNQEPHTTSGLLEVQWGESRGTAEFSAGDRNVTAVLPVRASVGQEIWVSSYVNFDGEAALSTIWPTQLYCEYPSDPDPDPDPILVVVAPPTATPVDQLDCVNNPIRVVQTYDQFGVMWTPEADEQSSEGGRYYIQPGGTLTLEASPTSGAVFGEGQQTVWVYDNPLVCDDPEPDPDPVTTTIVWPGNGSENADPGCQPGQTSYWHWILTPGGNNTLLAATLTVTYESGEQTVTDGVFRSGGGNGAMHFDVTRPGPDVVSNASVTFTYEGDGGNFVLTISGSECQGEPTPPVDPGDPGEPGDPGDPGQPGDPGDPGQPGQPTPPGDGGSGPATPPSQGGSSGSGPDNDPDNGGGHQVPGGGMRTGFDGGTQMMLLGAFGLLATLGYGLRRRFS